MRFTIFAILFAGLMAAVGFAIPMDGDWVGAYDPMSAVGPKEQCLSASGTTVRLLNSPVEHALGWYQANVGTWLMWSWQPVHGDSLDLMEHDGPVLRLPMRPGIVTARQFWIYYPSFWHAVLLTGGTVQVQVEEC